MIKTIRDDEIEAFLLNPFERAAYYKGKILQKYPFREDADHVIRVEEPVKASSACFILYDQKKILYNEFYESEPYFPENEPFQKLKDQIEEIKSDMCDLLIEKVDAKRKSFKSDPILKARYDKIKGYYFGKIVNVLLGAESFDFVKSSDAYAQIRGYVIRYNREEIVLATLDPKMYEPFIEELSEEDDVLVYDIFHPEIIKEAKEYVKAGVFTEKEKRLIKFIDKTKDCGAKKFTVIKESGESVSCLNKVTAEGGIPVAKNNEEIVDIEDISKVKYCNKIIYKK